MSWRDADGWRTPTKSAHRLPKPLTIVNQANEAEGRYLNLCACTVAEHASHSTVQCSGHVQSGMGALFASLLSPPPLLLCSLSRHGGYVRIGTSCEEFQASETSRQTISLTLADLGGVCESVLHASPDMDWNFYTVSAWPGHERNLMRRYFASNCGDGIAEGENGF
jgi:hypothetical protein